MDFLNLKQFSLSHLAILLFTLLFTLVFYFVFRKKTAKTKTVITFTFSTLALFAVIGTKVYYALTTNTANVFNYLPIQLSQISIILMVLACFLKSNKFKSVTFFIASFSAIYGLLVLENSILSTATLSIDTALYFLPYFFLMVASFILLSNIKVKFANIVSAYSLLVVLTSFAYTANVVFMEYFTNTGVLNYFYTIFPRDIIMDFTMEYLPFAFIYLMPLTAVFLVFSLILFAFAKFTQVGVVAQPTPQKLPKWEIDQTNEIQPEGQEADAFEKVEQQKQDEVENKEEQLEDKQTDIKPQAKETESKTEEKKEEDTTEYDNLNSYLDSILPPITEDTSSDEVTPHATEEKTFDISEILPADKEKDNKGEVEEQKIEVQLVDKNNEKTEQEPQTPLPETLEEVTVTQGEVKEVENKEVEVEEKQIEPKIEETTLRQEEQKEEKPEVEIEKETTQQDINDDSFTSIDDYDFMKELEEFKKMLNESDAKLFGDEKDSTKNLSETPTSTEKPTVVTEKPITNSEKPKGKKSNLDLLKALKNKVDKNNN